MLWIIRVAVEEERRWGGFLLQRFGVRLWFRERRRLRWWKGEERDRVEVRRHRTPWWERRFMAFGCGRESDDGKVWDERYIFW